MQPRPIPYIAQSRRLTPRQIEWLAAESEPLEVEDLTPEIEPFRAIALAEQLRNPTV